MLYQLVTREQHRLVFSKLPKGDVINSAGISNNFSVTEK